MKRLNSGIIICLLIVTVYYFWSWKYTDIVMEEAQQKRLILVEHTPYKMDPATDVMFLKTHKTGGSTLQNILFRKAYKNNLIVGLPKKGGNMLLNNSEKKFSKDLLLPPPKHQRINMLLSHMIFNHEEVSAVMHPKTVYIAMLREPAKRFESAFNYLYDRVPAFQKAKGKLPLLDYLENAKKYEGGSYNPSGIWWHGKNGIFYEFGYNNLNESTEYINEAINKIDVIFDFVLILEYFDMSLLLLADLLNWEMEDMIYIALNARNTSTVDKVDYRVRNMIYDWNKADTAMYKYFNATFWKRLEKYGKSRMTENLNRFQEMKEKFGKFCVESVIQINSKFNKDSIKTRVLNRYKLKENAKKNITCVHATAGEPHWFNNIMRYKKLN